MKTTTQQSTPYGYEIKNDQLVEVAHEQEALSIIKELRSRGITYAQIAKELSDRRINTNGRAPSAKESSDRRININGRAPFGYRWDEGELVEVPHEQKALAIITELRSRGITYATIAKELSDRGVTTKRGGQWCL